MDMNKELNQIILKYDIDIYYPQFRKRLLAEEMIRKLTDNLVKENRKVLFLATDLADIHHFKYVATENGDFKYLVFSEEKCDKLPWDEFDAIYLISMLGESKVAFYMNRVGVSYISLYDYFLENNIIFGDEYHHLTRESRNDYIGDCFPGKAEEWKNRILMEIMFLEEKKEKSHGRIRNIVIRKLFFLALFVKDFILAEGYLDCLTGDEKYDDYCCAWEEITNLLRKMKDELKKRKQKDVIMLWMDALSYGDTEGMNFLHEEEEKGVFFENAFTVTPFTAPTFKTLFCKAKEVDDESWKWTHIDEKNAPLIAYIQDRGYEFRDITAYIGSLDKKLKSLFCIELYTPASEVLWTAVHMMLNAEKPVFLIAHMVPEAHYPYMSPAMRMGEWDEERRKYLAHVYLDGQMKYYTGFFNDEVIKIFMSDHGQGAYRDKYHTYLSVVADFLKPKRIKELFSYIDFDKLIYQLLEKRQIDETYIAREYVELQSLDWYNKIEIEPIIRNKEPLTPVLFGYRGIVTREHMYLRFNTGKEWLVRRDDIGFEPHLLPQANDVCDESLLHYFRNLAGENRKDYLEDEKFKYTKYTYALYENFMKRKDDRVEIINRMLEAYPEDSVAIRMGGDHSAELYHILSADNRKKITCIIDKNPQCRCKKLGIPIIDPDDIAKFPVRAVILSSYDYIDLLRQEAEQYGDEIDILDIYKELEKHNIVCTDNFYVHNILQDEDYDVGFPFDE